MTGSSSGSKEAVELTTGADGSRELDWADGTVADQASRGKADQARGMDLDPESKERAAPISVADNACESGRSTVVNGAMEEDSFRASADVVVVEGMDTEPGEAEKKSAERENSTDVLARAEVVASRIERKSIDAEEYGRKGEVSNWRGDRDTESPVNESSPDRPLSRPRRSDSSRPGLRKLNTAKTRSSSLTSQRSAKLSLHGHQDPHSGATPESTNARGSRKREDAGEELLLLRQTSSSEELNGDEGDEVDGTGYRCGICNEDFESAKSLSLHKKYHPQYTLRRNPKRSRKLIDQEYAVDGVVAGVQAAAAGVPVQPSAGPTTTKKTSSMSEEFPKPCTECGKEFPSWKALFGHMRCHPEREWRGIQPPAEKSTAGQASGGSNHTSSFRRKKPTPLLPPPAAPSITITLHDDNNNEKSGSLKSGSRSQSLKVSDNESDTESIEAAYMSNGDRQTHRQTGIPMGWMKRSKRSRQTHRSLDAVNSVKTESNDMIEALMLLQSADKEKLTLVLTPESHGHGRGNSRSKSRTPESGLEAEADELPWKVKTEAEVASPCGDTEDGGDDFDAGEQGSGSARSKYECATCKRQFKSHQALGGHRASHKKVKGCFARTNVNDGGAHEQSQESMEAEDEELLKSEEQLMLPLPNELQQEASNHNSSEDNNNNKPCYLPTTRDENEESTLNTNATALNRKAKAHECTICHRVFTSGQALGGHKRCHWGGGSGTPGSSNELTSNINNNNNNIKPVQQQQVQTGQRRKEGTVQLDLNLPAPECLEEEEDMEAGISPMNYLPGGGGGVAGAGLSFFNIMNNNNNRNLYGESPAEQGAGQGQHGQQHGQQQEEAFLQGEESNQVEASRMEGINQFSNFERAYGPLDTITIHQKPHVPSMALVPGLTPTSA